jgi:hypothetical protein
MKHGNHETSIYLAHLTVHLGDFHTGHEFTHGETSQSDDDFGVDRCDLAIKVQVTGCQFFRQWVAVQGWLLGMTLESPLDFVYGGHTLYAWPFNAIRLSRGRQEHGNKYHKCISL